MQSRSLETVKWGFLLLVFAGTGLAFALFFENLDTAGTSLGIDRIFWAFRDWDIYYNIDEGLRNPPWSVLPLIPLGQISTNSAWGLLVYFTVAVLVASVPRVKPDWLYWLSVLLVVTAFPSLRNIADANLEGLVIAGGLLVVSGYRRQNPYVLALGVLLVTAKPQASSLLMLVLAVYVLATWPRDQWLKAGGLVALVVVPTMLWRGGDWLKAVQGTYQAGSIIDISLSAALDRTGVVPGVVTLVAVAAILLVTLWMVWRTRHDLPREKAGMLIAAALLIAPYAAGNSVINVMAIGIIPLFIASPVIGVVLIAMIDFPYLWSSSMRVDYESFWFTIILLLFWGIANWRLYRQMVN